MPRLWTSRQADSVDDFPGALVPLDEAHLHSHSYRAGRSDSPGSSGDDASEDDGRDKNGDGEDAAMLEMSAVHEYSIEGLRKEVRRGGRGKKWTAYERESGTLLPPFSSRRWDMLNNLGVSPVKSKLINKAIQDIGMGRYNWQLFVLCGFGWFADK